VGSPHYPDVLYLPTNKTTPITSHTFTIQFDCGEPVVFPWEKGGTTAPSLYHIFTSGTPLGERRVCSLGGYVDLPEPKALDKLTHRFDLWVEITSQYE
jgi:hypothetical protein